MDEIIDIVDNDGEPIGKTISKDKAHKEGVLHRVVHCHFYDSYGNIYLQKRSQSKKHFPGMLHCAIGGHIASGESVIDALIREGEEELGLAVSQSNLIFGGVFHRKKCYPEYELCDNEIVYDYIYCFDKSIDTLMFNDGEVESIEVVHIDTLLSCTEREYKEMNIIPYQFYPEIFQWIKKKISSDK